MALVPSIAALFVRWRKRVLLPRSLDPRQALGRRGEQLAARHLRRHGYKVLYKRFRARGGGEVDLVCRHKDTLVFVEVKTRRSTEHGRPLDAVGQEKQRLLARGANAWLRLLARDDVYYRFDVVEVLVEGSKARCEIVADAFVPPDQEMR